MRLGRLLEGALVIGARWGAWKIALERCLAAAKATGDRSSEACALHEMGTRSVCLGESSTARTLLRQALTLREALNEEEAAASSRRNLGFVIAPVSESSTYHAGTLAGRGVRPGLAAIWRSHAAGRRSHTGDTSQRCARDGGAPGAGGRIARALVCARKPRALCFTAALDERQPRDRRWHDRWLTPPRRGSRRAARILRPGAQRSKRLSKIQSRHRHRIPAAR